MSGSPAGGDFLASMAQASQARCARARQLRSEAQLRDFIARLPAPLPLALADQGFDLIAELKLRSPAVGALRPAASEDVPARVLAYAEAGAAAVSVLTEPSRFDGSMLHLEKAARALSLHGVPAMRKDFLVDPYQVLEARAAGAGGVLLILRMLPRPTLEALLDEALAQGLFVLLETFDEADIALAQELLATRRERAPRDALLVGVNCRDLATLQVVPGRLEALAARLPTEVPRVAESGVGSAADAARVAAAGYDLALVGSALMSGGEPRQLAASMLEAARAAIGRRSRRGSARSSAPPVEPGARATS
ncbi:MAG: indole-3-glycerol-phosphate synthase [Steroidobacteraceae bacterium]|nr:indole-3-glycerol-phosphate synthase [Nevskiaceae bacterium]MCP5338699.1 indole-3-glycerol-phosphate synthase [Nevskiaceae bacterium]MCP5473079.1 indole-3-glycerol-phosphate synthase [Nevskiaceae bacterium]